MSWPPSKMSRVQTMKCYFRAFSTNQGKPNCDGFGNEKRYIIYDHDWPKKEDPTPYDIFNFATKCDIDHKLLRQQYHKYVKLYHPDVSSNSQIHHTTATHIERLLSPEEKVARFKVMSLAYELLKDQRKKSMYDISSAGWNVNDPYATEAASYYSSPNYSNSYGYHSDATYAYWNSGTWSDARNANADPGQKFDAWTFMTWIFGLYVCMKGVAIIKQFEEAAIANPHTQEDSEEALLDSYTNFGLGTDKWTRLKRFLWFRVFTSYTSQEDLDKKIKENNALIKRLEEANK